nr:hypothetical protein [Tanacetum cinerariifolium]GEX22344.1 hypothetical protein [Tanacetum cinerariifolium]
MTFTSLSSSSDNEVQSCLKACSKAYDQLNSQYDKLTVEFRKSEIDVLSYQTALKSVEARLVVYKQNESILEENIKMLTNEVQARDLSHAKPAHDLSHTTRPMAPIIEDWVSDTEDEFESNDSQNVPSLVQPTEHVKPSGHPDQPSKPVFNTVVRPVSVAVPKIIVTRPRLAHSPVTKSKSPIRWHITHSPSLKTSNSPPKVTVIKASVVSVVQDYELAATLRAEEQR